MYPIYIDTPTCTLASIAEALPVITNKKSVARGVKAKPAVAAKRPTAKSPVAVERRQRSPSTAAKTATAGWATAARRTYR